MRLCSQGVTCAWESLVSSLVCREALSISFPPPLAPRIRIPARRAREQHQVRLSHGTGGPIAHPGSWMATYKDTITKGCDYEYSYEPGRGWTDPRSMMIVAPHFHVASSAMLSPTFAGTRRLQALKCDTYSWDFPI